MADTPLGNLIENELKEKEQRKLELQKANAKKKAKEEFYKSIIEEDSKKYTVFNENDEQRIFVRKATKEKPKPPSLQRQFGQTLNFNLNNKNRKNTTPPVLSRGLPVSNNFSNQTAGGKLTPSSNPNNSSSLIQGVFKK